MTRSATAFVSALAAIAFFAPPATGGTLTVNIDGIDGCNMFSVTSGGGSGLIASPPCVGSAQFGITFWGFDHSVPAGTGIGLQTVAPPGITINSAYASPASVVNIDNGTGWGGGSYWTGGGRQWNDTAPVFSDGPFNSSYWGFHMLCGLSQCSGTSAHILLNTVRLTATENQGPGLIAVGANNLWYQSGRWIWNAAHDSWPITLYATDPSGVCYMWATLNNVTLPGPSANADASQWHQCPDPTWTPMQGAAVDTRDYIAGDGQLALQFGATNAAGVPSTVSETLNVDNDAVRVSFSTPNDANPTVWVPHAVRVDAAASAGPSGVAGMSCGVDRGAAETYPTSGITVDGDGVHSVSCTAWNNAVDPQGAANTGTSSTTVKIDEAPPSLGFEPQNPSDPAHVVVDVADGESGVAGGTVQIAPAGTSNWTSLPTAFDGQHLMADINDAGLRGSYSVRATSCDSVGNCASSDEDLSLPLRLGATSAVSFTKIVAPTMIARTRVLVGWHYRRVRRRHTVFNVRTGGHYVTVRIVIRKNAVCASRRIRTGRHRWQEVSACRKVNFKSLSTERVAYGRRATVHGLLITSQGVPIAHAPIQILAAPDNGLDRFIRIATTVTNGNGAWSAILPPGPSRIIRASYAGSSSILPASGSVRTIVPARIRLISVSPQRVPWGGTIHIVGRLEGGYLPPGGALVRLRIGVGSAVTTYGVEEHVTGSGRFSTTYTFGLGDSSVLQSYWFQIASLPMGNYPYAPANSSRLSVLVGGQPSRRCCRSG